MGSCVSLIFSKDRALQLDATLCSFLFHCKDAELLEIRALYTTTTSLYAKQYRKLKNECRQSTFLKLIGEKKFHSDVIALLAPFDYVFFLTDDNIFVRDFFLIDVLESLQNNPDAIGFSLRLGKNTTYCYPLDKAQRLPEFQTVGQDILKYNWTNAEYDFGYPLEVSSSVYRVEEIIPFIAQLQFKNPNTLESMMAEQSAIFRNEMPYLLCFEQSVTFCAPVNMVQTMWTNRTSNKIEYSPNNLARLFDDGLRIDICAYNNFIPNACHQEVELKFVEPAKTNKEQQQMVSVIIPCYNQAQYLPEAVESVVNQTYQHWECIIVNDGSPDNASEVAQQLIAKYPTKRIVLLEKENGGLADARNFGIRNSRGKYILPLDADDIIRPERLQKMVSLLKAHPDIAIAYTDMEQFGIANKIIREKEYDFKHLCFQNHLNYCSLYKREAWEAAGGYNPNMVQGYEDWDFWISLGEKGYYGKRIPEPLFLYRVKDSSMYTKSLEHHDKLIARIILNHPCLYEKEDIAAAEKVLNITDSTKNALSDTVSTSSCVEGSGSEGSILKIPLSSGRAEEMPYQVHFLMNDRCNAKCIMCGGDYFRSGSGRMITFEKFKKMALNLKLQYFQSIVLAGAGDPLLDRDLIPIIQFVKKEYPHIRISITTNGIALSQILSKSLLENNVDFINISINSATRKTYQRIMQVDCFNKVCDNVRKLIVLRDKLHKVMRLQFSIAINRLNIEELPALVELGKDIGIDSINVMYCRFYPEQIRHLNIENPENRLNNSESLFYHQNLSDTTVEIAKLLANKYKICLTHEPMFKENALPKPCRWHFHEIMVGFDGEIYPCGGAEVHFKDKVESGIYNFGNALAAPIESFWNSELYRALRISSAQKEACFIPECRRCANIMSPNDVRSHIMEWEEKNSTSESMPLIKSPDLDNEPQLQNKTLPMVSVIVPTYNRPDMLAETLKSILNQTFQDFEIIVVNDAGIDVSHMIENYNQSGKIVYIQHEKNKGLAASRNTGVQAARGKYIAYLDDDDIFYPDHLETLINFLETTDYKVAYTDAYRAYQEMRDGRYVTVRREVTNTSDFDYDRILFGNFIPVLCIIHEKACIDQAGLFDETLGAHEDWDLWIRMSRKFEFGHIKTITCEFSWRTDNSTMTLRNKEIMDSTREIVFLRGQELRRKEMSQRNTTGRRSGMPVIPDTTLCCIDCYNQELSIKALRHCLKVCHFEKAIFLTDRAYNLEDIEVKVIPGIQDKKQYSAFIIKELDKYIDTKFVLMIQYDGFIVNPDVWSDEFHKYDYIGAKWFWYNDGLNIGNGGFSLRSKRLLSVLSNNDIVLDSLEYGEDTFICRTYRGYLEKKYDIKFAPVSIADRFSYERSEPASKTFGFHGLYNMWRYIKPDKLRSFMHLLSPKTLNSIEARELGMNYKVRGRFLEAEIIYRKILEYHPENTDVQSLLRAIQTPSK